MRADDDLGVAAGGHSTSSRTFDPRRITSPAEGDRWHWTVSAEGRFVWWDAGFGALLGLPLTSPEVLCWADLVLPGTDLGFLARPEFCEVVAVGVQGRVRRWELAGSAVTSPGGPGTSGTARELA